MNRHSVPLLSRLGASLATLATLSGLAAFDATAQDYRVMEMTGTVEVQRAPSSGWQPLTPSYVLQPADLIRTGADGTVTLQAADATIRRILPGTLFTVDGVATSPLAPPGVPPHRWISLGPTLGIALSERGLGSASSLEGVLMLRSGDTWLPIRLSAPPANPRQVVPAK